MTILHLLPQPQQLTFTEGSYRLSGGKLISIPSPIFLFTAQRLQGALAQRGLRWGIVMGGDSEQIGIRLLRQSAPSELENAYQVRITPEGITLIGSQNPVTLWHAALTLIQILQQSGEALPCLHIDDQPTLPPRRDARHQPRPRPNDAIALRAGRSAGELEDQRDSALYRAHLRLSETSRRVATRLAADGRRNPRPRPLLPRALRRLGAESEQLRAHASLADASTVSPPRRSA